MCCYVGNSDKVTEIPAIIFQQLSLFQSRFNLPHVKQKLMLSEAGLKQLLVCRHPTLSETMKLFMNSSNM